MTGYQTCYRIMYNGLYGALFAKMPRRINVAWWTLPATLRSRDFTAGIRKSIGQRNAITVTMRLWKCRVACRLSVLARCASAWVGRLREPTRRWEKRSSCTRWGPTGTAKIVSVAVTIRSHLYVAPVVGGSCPDNLLVRYLLVVAFSLKFTNMVYIAWIHKLVL